MNILNPAAIHELIESRQGLCVSMFLPMHPRSREQQQDSIRLKNLTTAATGQLLERGMRRPDASEMVEPAERLPLEIDFWRQRSEGLACFCARDFFRAYHVPLRLDECLTVNRRFHIKPLLPLLRSNARFYILALSQESAALYEATQHWIHELQLPHVERVEVNGNEQALQYHAHRAPSQGKGAVQEAIYHGHGGSSDRTKTDVLHYFQRVDRSVTEVLRGQRAPLVLACVGYLAPIYEAANSYPQLAKVKVPGSPGGWTLDELRQHAWQLVEPRFQQEQAQALSRFYQAQSNRQASDDVREIVLAADVGRVESLFVQQGVRRWGRIDADRQVVELYDKADSSCEELLDYAAVRTLESGGDVYSLEEIPDVNSPIAATYRY